MTKENIEKFINMILKGLYPDWLPTIEERQLWSYMLQYCDYEKSAIAIRNWFTVQEKQTRRPPFGKLRQVLRKVYRRSQGKRSSESVLLYTIVCEELLKAGKRGGQKFYVGSENRVPQNPEVIHEEAERMRNEFNAMYGRNHIIVYK